MSSEATTSDADDATDEWPAFDLSYTFNPNHLSLPSALDPDEVVVLGSQDDGGVDDDWITAKRGSYVPLEETR